MISLELYRRGTEEHLEACRYVRAVYNETSKLEPTHMPDTVIVARRRDEIVGCIGLLHEIKTELHLVDPQLQEFLETRAFLRDTGEQLFFATRGAWLSAVALIVALVAYSESVGIKYVVYSAIPTALRMVNWLELPVLECWDTNIDGLSESEYQRHQVWFEQFNPRT